jgi:hypothetical protein
MKLSLIESYHVLLERLQELSPKLAQIVNNVVATGFGPQGLLDAMDKVEKMVVSQLGVDGQQARKLIDDYLVSVGKDQWYNTSTAEPPKPELPQADPEAIAKLSTTPKPREPVPMERVPELLQKVRERGQANPRTAQWQDLWSDLYEEVFNDNNILHHHTTEYFGRGPMSELFPPLYTSEGYLVFEHTGYIVLANPSVKGAAGSYVLRNPSHKTLRQYHVRAGDPVQEWANNVAAVAIGKGGSGERKKLTFRKIVIDNGLALFTRRDKETSAEDYHQNLTATMHGIASNFTDLAQFWGPKHAAMAEDLKKLIETIAAIRQLIVG